MSDEPKLTVKEALAKRAEEIAAGKSETVTALATQAADRQVAQIPQWARELKQFDWKQLQPHQTALLLMQKKYKKKSDSGTGYETYRLSFDQALIFAIRCFELGLSPFSSEVWFNPDTEQVATTVEGRRTWARNHGMNFGPPLFEWSEHEWPKGLANPCSFPKDLECVCTMEVQGWKQPATYTARLSEWAIGGPRGQWALRTKNMLQTRAMGQCLTFASGVGVSEMPDENSFTPKESTEDAGSPAVIDVKAEEYKPLK